MLVVLQVVVHAVTLAPVLNVVMGILWRITIFVKDVPRDVKTVPELRLIVVQSVWMDTI